MSPKGTAASRSLVLTPKSNQVVHPCLSSPPRSKIPVRVSNPLASSSFHPVNLFSIPAVVSYTFLTDPASYILSFHHQGIKQQALLESTFLTALEKDKVKITWGKAKKDLANGNEVIVDVTQVKTALGRDNWLVFGLYLSSPLHACLPHDKVEMNSKQEEQAQTTSYAVREYESVLPSKIPIKSELSLQDLSNTTEMPQCCSPTPCLAVSADTFSIPSEDNAKDSCDDTLSVSFGSVSDPEDAGDSMLVNPDTSIKHIEDISMIEDKSTIEEVTTEEEDATFASLCFETIFLNSCTSQPDELTDGQFEDVLALNGLVENYDDLASNFESIFKDSFQFHSSDLSGSGTHQACAEPAEKDKVSGDSSVSSNDNRNTTASTPVKTLNNGDCEAGTDLDFVDPQMASTPYEKIHESLSSSLRIDSINDRGFLPTKMDSGFYESFSASIQISTKDREEEHQYAEIANSDNLKKVEVGLFKQIIQYSISTMLTEIVSIL